MFLMEDFYYAGGMPAILHELKEKLVLEQPTVSGRTVGEIANSTGCESYNKEVIRPFNDPLLKGPCKYLVFLAIR